MTVALRTPRVTNLTLASADTQYTHTLAQNCRVFSVQCRTAVDIRMALATGIVASPSGNYITVKSGGAYNSPEGVAVPSGTILYFAGDSGGEVVEIFEWLSD